MTTQADYTQDEWRLLSEAPYLIAAAVSAAGKTGFIDSLRENFALRSAPTQVAKEFPQNDLVQAIAGFKEAKSEAASDLKAESNIKERALEACRSINQLVEEKIPDLEGLEYKRWLMHVAERVARASDEGGFLGFGKKTISAEEQETLTQIATALDVTYPF